MESDFLPTKSIKVIDGVGINGFVNLHNEWLQVSIGNERLLQTYPNACTAEQSIEVNHFIQTNKGSSIIIVLVNSIIEIIMAISDEIREESKEFVTRAKNLGLSVTMLTGDQQSVAALVSFSLIHSSSIMFMISLGCK